MSLIDVRYLPLFSEKVKKFLEDLKEFILERKTPKDEGKPAFVEAPACVPKGTPASADKSAGKDFKTILADFSTKYKTAESDQDFRNFLAALSLRAEVEYDEDAEEEIQLCLTELKSIELKDKLKEISEELKKAENEKDSEKINNLIAEFNNLAKQL